MCAKNNEQRGAQVSESRNVNKISNLLNFLKLSRNYELNMSLIKKIVEIVERSDNVDARKNIAKLTRDIKSHKEKVKQ